MSNWNNNGVINAGQVPAIASGNLSDIPAYNIANMLFVSMDTQALYANDGAGFILIGGPGTGTITGSGTAGKLTKFVSASVIGDSIVTESGTQLSIAGSLTTNGYTIETTNITINEAGTGNGSIIYLKGGAIYYNFIIAKQYTPGFGNNAVEITPSTVPGGSVFSSPVFVVDYLGNSQTNKITATQHIVPGGLSTQFLKADGSLDSNTYLTTSSAGTTYVPYMGANANVNLSTFFITATQHIVPGGLSTQFLKADGSLDGTSYAPSVAGGYLPLTAGASYPLTGTLHSNGNIVVITSQASGTPRRQLFFSNTVTDIIVGFESEIGGTTFTGSTASALLIGGSLLKPIEFFTNGSKRVIISETGLFYTLSRLNVNGATDNAAFALNVTGQGNFSTLVSVQNRTFMYAGGLLDNSANTGIYFGVDGVFATDGSGVITEKDLGSSATGWNRLYFKQFFATISSNYFGAFNSTNINGGYCTFETNSTVLADFGTTINIFGVGDANTFGINARGARSFFIGTNNTARLEVNSSGQLFTSSRVNINGATDSATYSLNIVGGISNTTGNNYFNSTSGATSIGTGTNTYKLNVAGGIYDSDTQSTLNQSKFGVFGGMTYTATGTETATYINAGIAGGYVMASVGTFTPLATAKQGAIVGSYYATAASTVSGIQNVIYSNCELASSGTITTLAAYRAGKPEQFSGGSAFTGTITNMVGLYIDDISASSLAARFTNKYGIYQVGTSDKNFFGGEIILGAGQVVSASTTNTNTNKIKLIVNGITYYLLASTSAT